LVIKREQPTIAAFQDGVCLRITKAIQSMKKTVT